MNPNHGLAAIGTFAAAAAIAAVASAVPSNALAASFQPYTGQATTTLNVRSTPGTDRPRIGYFKQGATFQVTGIEGKSDKGNWLKIEYNNKTAYVDGYYVTMVVAKTKAAPAQSVQKVSAYTGVTTDNLNVRFLPNVKGTVLTTLKKGSTVTVTGKTSDGWLQISYKSGSAYVSSAYVNTSGSDIQQEKVAPPKTLYTAKTTDNLNVRSGASTSNKILATLKKGSSVDVVGTSGSWLEINYQNSIAYVSGAYVAKSGSSTSSTGTSVTVLYTGNTTDDLNVRSGASTTSKILTTLKKGSSVDVVGTSGSWLKIKYNNGTAYVSGDYVQKSGITSSSSGTSPVTSTDSITIVSVNVNFRTGPGTNYKSMGVINSQSKITKLADAPDGWVKISYNGQDGYVYGSYVKQEKITTTQTGNAVYQTTQYPISFGQALALEQKVNSSSDLAYYMNPNNFQQGTPDYFQFLKLSSLSGVTASQVNAMLKGDGILQNHGTDFVNAAKTYGVNEIYLVSHALLETGNGSSTLANGVSYKGKTVYNMFGIGAFDLDPTNGGAALALEDGWFTPSEAIWGGAKWIAENYVYNTTYQQDTLYKMRWNPDALISGSAAHQYATDPGWAVNQTGDIQYLYAQIKLKNILYDVPQYN
ncbi:SH3 domain-containing protein [Sporolactobacillus pectinivorans]|uniref:SH3 domain-containing protein n=1 Tax=Sporolactobacillus pectinivorans TaxID=1591408 RepID=UPI000C26A573|nr:SH3 domain-containing protein [Sporolactobacillus pectinivorans]